MSRLYDKIIGAYEKSVSDGKTSLEVVEDLIKAHAGKERISLKEMRFWMGKTLEATEAQLANIEDLLVFYANDAARLGKLKQAKEYFTDLKDAIIESGLAESASNSFGITAAVALLGLTAVMFM